MRVTWKCPYCNTMNFTAYSGGPMPPWGVVMICDPDQDGCDQPCMVEVQAQTHCRRIEGYQDMPLEGAR